MTIDSKTLVIKADNENDIPEIIDYINQKDKSKNISSFLQFASENRIEAKNYKFNREECYDR
jgi:hypothetical protein